jgi:hypothetical protein
LESDGTPAAADDGGVGFLDDLGPSSPATKSASKASATASARSAASVRSSAAAAPSMAASTGLSRAAAARAKKQAEQMKMIYIGGGVAAAVVLVVIIAVAVSGGSGAGGKEKDQDVKYNLTQTQRKKLYVGFIHAVDVYGVSTKCRDAWRRLGTEAELDDSQVSAVVKEGLDRGWDQPAIEATMDQTQKVNRRDWIRKMTEAGGREPIMSL